MSATRASVRVGTKKAPSRSTQAANDPSGRTGCAWLVRDRRALVAAIVAGERLGPVSIALERESVAVVRFIGEGGIADLLLKAGLDFTFEQGSEEEVEFMGLALSGVPLNRALQWCLALDDRPTADGLHKLMLGDDLRPALCLARDCGVSFVHSGQVKALRFLGTEPEARVRDAVAAVRGRYDVPSPVAVSQQIFGAQVAERPYPWGGEAAQPKSKSKTTASGAAPKPRSSGRSAKRGGSSSTGYRKKVSSSGSKRKYWGRKRSKSSAAAGPAVPTVFRESTADYNKDWADWTRRQFKW